VDAPFGFKHDLDPDLFALDRLSDLVKRAPEGRFVAQLADSDRVRQGQDATYTKLEGSLAEDIARRGLHVHFDNLEEWAPEYVEAGKGVLEQVRSHERSTSIHSPNIVIRVFSAEAPAALHGDGNTQVNCGVGGRTLWHFGPPSNLTPIEIESLMRGGMFLGWRELQPVQTFDLAVGDACAAPPRWPHWLEHPGPEPAVSFELSYWTPETIRDRKVYDVNWLMRKAHLAPGGPGGRSDRLKCMAFDAISTATRRGLQYRGHV
jgi:hypothetical protein